MKFVYKVVVTSFAVVITAKLLPGVYLPNYIAAILVALVLSLLNTFLRPLLVLLTIPASILTFGLFLLFLNAFMILLTSSIVDDFKIDSFGTAFIFSIILSLITFLLELPEKLKSGKVVVKKFKE
ncbi:MAG: phage holin family protein [Bacteroidota bacterium]